MTDIGVYTTVETLDEKKEFAEDPEYCTWWVLPRAPKNPPSYIFFAAQGTWKGYFTVEKIVPRFDEFKIYLDEWYSINERIERSQFQGFTYNVPSEVIQ